MSAPAGYQGLFFGSTDGATYNEILLATDVKPGSQKNDMLDRTYYGQGDAQKRRSKGLHDNSVTLKLDYDHTNARVVELMAAGDAGSDYYLKVLIDGTNGWLAKGIVENYDLSPPINGKSELTVTWLPNANKTAVP